MRSQFVPHCTYATALAIATLAVASSMAAPVLTTYSLGHAGYIAKDMLSRLLAPP